MGNSQSNEVPTQKARDRSSSVKEHETVTSPSAIKKRTSVRRNRQVLTSSSPPRVRKGSVDTESVDPGDLSVLDETDSTVPQAMARRDSSTSLLTSGSPHGDKNTEESKEKVPVTIKWSGPGEKVYITGTFTLWRKKIALQREEGTNEFTATLNLVPGTHRLKFYVDGEWKTSDSMAVATDSSGNFVNYIEASLSDEYLALTRSRSAVAALPAKAPIESWTNTIPSFMTPSEELLNSPAMIPPSLPPHLEKVILNTSNERKDDHSVLPHPNHVVLNHLAASSIRNGVLAVSASTRYRRKYVTTILYKPAN